MHISFLKPAIIGLFPIIFLFSFSVVFANHFVPQNIRQALNETDIYIENDGLTKWEGLDDGSIVEYFIGIDTIKTKIDKDTNTKIVYDRDGNIILKETHKIQKFYNKKGELQDVIKIERNRRDTRIIFNASGEAINVLDDENAIVSIGDNLFTMQYKNKHLLIKVLNKKLVYIEQPTIFSTYYFITPNNNKIYDKKTKKPSKNIIKIGFIKLFTSKVDLKKVEGQFNKLLEI